MATEYNPYRVSSGSAEAGTYDAGYNQDDHSHLEMQPLPRSPSPTHGASSTVLSQSAFLARTSSLQASLLEIDREVSAASALHGQLLAGSPSPDDPAGAASAPPSHSALDAVLTGIHHSLASVRDQIADLNRDVNRTSSQTEAQSRRVKSGHLTTLKNDFRARLHDFQAREARFRTDYRTQIGRQYRIVRPEATDQEVEQALDSSDLSSGGGAVFQQAMMQSQGQRQGQAKAVLGAVQTRHADLQLIERTMHELATILQDLDGLVEQQDETVIHVESATEDVKDNLEAGNVHLVEAVGWAEKLRRHKWICLGISLAILLIIVIIIVLVVVLTRQAN